MGFRSHFLNIHRPATSETSGGRNASNQSVMISLGAFSLLTIFSALSFGSCNSLKCHPINLPYMSPIIRAPINTSKGPVSNFLTSFLRIISERGDDTSCIVHSGVRVMYCVSR